MKNKSRHELEIVSKSIKIRSEQNKTQAYIAMLLDVTDGHIGHIENCSRPEMYTHDQINAIALDFDISPQLFYPEKATLQPLPKTDHKVSLERTKNIDVGLLSLVNSSFFEAERSIRCIIDELNKREELSSLNISNKDLTDLLRPIVKKGILISERVGTKNQYRKV